ncbi:futalosine hydrolase [Paenibacillus guangzhouensis]|uniref:futalosine hydrolase n=1 Tax=Paenibacillus guangzhouensis TaxID=1473112 RepID=UPI0012670970|nr:futalosine hydrolase [Paenibacillus guangzhouensis]
MLTQGNEGEAAQAQKLRVLIMTSVEAERQAVLRGLQDQDRFDVCVAGVGSVIAAINTTKAIHTGDYDLVVNAGIAGGFIGRAEIGSVVVSEGIIAADLGAESGEGFISVDELGFGSSQIAVDAILSDRVTEALRAAELPVQSGLILTLSTVTGTQETADSLASRFPTAVAEAMEGYGVAAAAASYGLPVLELRSISNNIGPRNREAWRIPDALTALTAAFARLEEVL